MFVHTRDIVEVRRRAQKTPEAAFLGMPVEFCSLTLDGNHVSVPAYVIGVRRTSTEPYAAFRVDLAFPTIREEVWIRHDDHVVREGRTGEFADAPHTWLAHADEYEIIAAQQELKLKEASVRQARASLSVVGAA